MKSDLTKALVDVLVRKGYLSADDVIEIEGAGDIAKKERKFSPEFVSAWKLYPSREGYKVGKLPAYTEWKKLGLDRDSELRERVIGCIYSLIRSGTIPKDMHRWLKAEPWHDESAPIVKRVSTVLEEEW